MHVALAQASIGDANKTGSGLQFMNCGAAQVPHTRTKTADELIHHGLERPAIGHPAFDAFWHKLGQTILAVSLAAHHALAALRLGKAVARPLEVALPRAL